MKKKDVEVKGTSSESANENVLFVFSHLPTPDRQMSIYGLVVKDEKTEESKVKGSKRRVLEPNALKEGVDV